MKLGFTYDLRDDYLAEGYGEEETAEFDRPGTTDALAGAMEMLGHEVDRIGSARRLTERLVAGDAWDLVFNITEGLWGVGREAQTPAILDLYGIPYTFSDPLVSALTLHKGMTKAIVERSGVPTAKWLNVSSPDELDATGFPGFPGPWFVKPNAEGTGKGVSPKSKCLDAASLAAEARRLMTEFKQPVIIEPFLSGREFTVGLIGTGEETQVLGTLEIVLLAGAEAEIYSYVNKERCEELVEYRLVRPSDPVVQAAELIAAQAWKALGCRDGGRVDLRCDAEGRPHFLEVNPLPGLHPSHSDLPMLATAVGMPYVELIGRIIESAATRIATTPRLKARRPASV